MKQVSCGSCEYRWRTRQYLQNEECQNVLSKRFLLLRENRKRKTEYIILRVMKKKNSNVRAAGKVFPHTALTSQPWELVEHSSTSGEKSEEGFLFSDAPNSWSIRSFTLIFSMR